MVSGRWMMDNEGGEGMWLTGWDLGGIQKCILLWMMDSAERDAILMYELMKVGGKKADRAPIGLVCTRTAGQIYLIKQAYYTMFNQTLENHIDGTDSTFMEFQTKVR
jgi:hypothetical protein